MSLTTFRQAVAADIAAALGIARVIDGRVEGPAEREDIVCSWPVGKTESRDSAHLEEIEVAVRVLKAFRQERDPKKPHDPAPLEAALEAIQAGSSDIQASAGPWFWRPVELTIDMDAQAVDVRVVGTQWNQFAQV